MACNERNSSVELFRIIAALLVMIVHLNGWFLSLENITLYSNHSLSGLAQTFISSISIVCVNCFLIISGFYGIKFKLKNVWNIYLTLVSIYVPFYILESIISKEFSLISFLGAFVALHRESYFVQCYLMLIVLSPILNAFIEKQNSYILRYSLLFAVIAFVFDCIFENQCLSFNHGFSLTHFIFIYILARTAFIYQDKLKQVKSRYYLLVYLVCCILIASLKTLGCPWAFYYTNPLNVIASFSLFIPFLKHSFHNKIVNDLAKSSLSAYIMHITPPLMSFIAYYNSEIYLNFSYFTYLLLIIIGSIIIYIICYIYDRMRFIVFSRFTDKMYDFLVDLFVRNKTKKISNA